MPSRASHGRCPGQQALIIYSYRIQRRLQEVQAWIGRQEVGARGSHAAVAGAAAASAQLLQPAAKRSQATVWVAVFRQGHVLAEDGPHLQAGGAAGVGEAQGTARSPRRRAQNQPRLNRPSQPDENKRIDEQQ